MGPLDLGRKKGVNKIGPLAFGRKSGVNKMGPLAVDNNKFSFRPRFFGSGKTSGRACWLNSASGHGFSVVEKLPVALWF